MQYFKFETACKNLGQQCEAVLRSVPEWFGREDALLQYVNDIDSLDTYTAWFKDELVGFFSVKMHNEKSAELFVLAVNAKYHRNKIGSKLFELVENDLKSRQVRYLQVKTMSALSGDVNYEKTRRFYLAMGFQALEEFDTLWGKDLRCLQMLKCI